MANYAIFAIILRKEDSMEPNERIENTESVENVVDTSPEQIDLDAQRRREERRRRHELQRKKAQQMRIIKLGVAILAIVAGLTLLLVMLIHPKDKGYSEYEAKLDKLTLRKQQLLVELDKLGPDMDKRLGNTSYMSLLFTTLDSALYTSAHPVMAEGSTDIVGIMALSPNELPDLDGKITKKQFDTLLALNWGTALYWNGEGDLEDYILQMQVLLDEHKIDFPTTMAFKSKTFKLEYDEILLKYGIKNALHGDDAGLPIRVQTEPTGVWHPGYIGWKASGSSLLKRQVESDGGYALFEISFSQENSSTAYFDVSGETEGARSESFRKMINLFKSSVKSGAVEVLSTEETRAKVEKYYSERSSIEIENAQARQQINAEIAEIERQMTALYHEYNG